MSRSPGPDSVFRVRFAADHAGAALKDELIRRLDAAGLGHELIDLGGDGSDPADDYPDFAQRLGLAIQRGEADRGILVCGSGVGANVAINKMRGLRSSVCHDTYSARQGVEHDDMNVLTLGARVIGPEPAVECSLAFLAATVLVTVYAMGSGSSLFVMSTVGKPTVLTGFDWFLNVSGGIVAVV